MCSFTGSAAFEETGSDGGLRDPGVRVTTLFGPEPDCGCSTPLSVAVYKLCCILELNHILPTFRGVTRNVTSHCMSVCACIHSNVGQGGIYSHVCGCIHA